MLTSIPQPEGSIIYSEPCHASGAQITLRWVLRFEITAVAARGVRPPDGVAAPSETLTWTLPLAVKAVGSAV